MRNKNFLKNLFLMGITIIISTTIFAQKTTVEIIGTIKTSIEYVNDLTYHNDSIIILSGEDLIFLNKNGEIIKKQLSQNLNGIYYDKTEDEILIIDNDLNISEFNKNKKNKLNIKAHNKGKTLTNRFIAKNDSGYITYIDEGWSSRIAFFDLSGIEVFSVLAPGFGEISGLTINNNSIWIISDLGNNKQGIIRKYILSSGNIIEKYATEIPVINPKGLTITDENCFITYSGQSKEIIKLKINDL